MTFFKQIFRYMVLLVTFVFNFTDFLPRKQVTCDIRGQAFGLAVLCFFPEDINVSRGDYAVYLYKESRDPIVVVSCMWPEGQEHVQCEVGPGYIYDELIYPDRISIQIINASDSHVGMYECQLSRYKDLGQCKLLARQIVPTGKQKINTESTVEEVSASVSATQVGDGDDDQKQHTRVQSSTTTDPACGFLPVNDGKAHREKTFGTGVGCGIGITVAVFFLGIFLWKKYRHFISQSCLNVGKTNSIKYSKAQQQEENSETLDGPTELEEETNVHRHLVAQEGFSEFTDGSKESEGKTALNFPEAKETSSPCQTTTTGLVETPNSGRSKEQNTSRDKDNVETSGLQQEEPSSTHLAKSLGQNTLSYEGKLVVNDAKEKVGSTNNHTKDPPQTSDHSSRGCGSTMPVVCSGHDKADSQEQRNHFMFVNGTGLQISVTVKVEHVEGLKEDLEESTICNCRKYKSQGQGESSISQKESNPENGHITAGIGKQEVIQSIDFPGLSIIDVLTSHDHNIQETSEKNSMGLHFPPESGPAHYFGRNSHEEVTLPAGDENHENLTSKYSNSLLNASDFDIRPVKKPENSPTSQQNDERLSTVQSCAELSSGLDTGNKFSSVNGEDAIGKSKEMIKDVQEGESSSGAQVTSPAENSLNIRSHVHSQPPD